MKCHRETPRRVCPVKGSKSQILREEVGLAVLGPFFFFLLKKMKMDKKCGWSERLKGRVGGDEFKKVNRSPLMRPL